MHTEHFEYLETGVEGFITGYDTWTVVYAPHFKHYVRISKGDMHNYFRIVHPPPD